MHHDKPQWTKDLDKARLWNRKDAFTMKGYKVFSVILDYGFNNVIKRRLESHNEVKAYWSDEMKPMFDHPIEVMKPMVDYPKPLGIEKVPRATNRLPITVFTDMKISRPKPREKLDMANAKPAKSPYKKKKRVYKNQISVSQLVGT